MTGLRSFRLAPPARAGCRVTVVAPASPFDRAELFRGLAWLATRYRLRIDERVLAHAGYLAGDDASRAAVLARAMTDPDVDAILCARGGYGAMRILDALPWDSFAARPKRLVGFSDITALHLTAQARGIATIHGPNVTGLGRKITARERACLLAALEDGPLPPPLRTWNLEMLIAGDADGPVIGGNLALVQAMAAGGRLDLPDGAIVVLEDVTEKPYRIDRMLTSLRLGGHFARAAAIVFGGFTQCDPGPDGVAVIDVLRNRTADLGIPIAWGAPFGHGSPNEAFVLGGRARLRGGQLLWGDL
jgi:muramoyltetrapeptide carboxypeptidase